MIYALIDISEAWPGQQQAWPWTSLHYSATGMQVLGLYATQQEAEEALEEAQDRSHLQRLRIVDIGDLAQCIECHRPVADSIRCPDCDTHCCQRTHRCG
jgi:hypothetical protein